MKKSKQPVKVQRQVQKGITILLMSMIVLSLFSLNSIYNTRAASQIGISAAEDVTVNFQYGVSPSSSYTGAIDTYISQLAPNDPFGQAARLLLDGDDPVGTGNDIYSLLQWDVSSIPITSTISSASITLFVNTAAVSNYSIPIYSLKRQWSENQATWNVYSFGNNWQVPGAAGTDDRDPAVVAMLQGTSTGFITVPFGSAGLALVQSWVSDPTTNHGLIISDPALAGRIDLDSNQSTTAANRPRLSISYQIPPVQQTATAGAATATASAIAATDNAATATASFVAPTQTSIAATSIAGTATAIAAATQTATASITPTIVPSINLVKSVSPSQASRGAAFTFSIGVGNASVFEVSNVVIRDGPFPATLTITGAQITPSNSGTFSINQTTRVVTFFLDPLSANKSVTLAIYTQVNTNATTNTNETNVATMTYTAAGFSFSKTSNSVTYRVLGATTLPGTGGLQAPTDDGNGLAVIVFVSALIIALVGLGAIGFSLWARKNQPTWSGWLIRMGIFLCFAGLIFGAGAWAIGLAGQPAAPVTSVDNSVNPIATSMPEEDLSSLYLPTSTPLSLPDFPIPTPSLSADTANSENQPDTSPIEHIYIPGLSLDTVVKYVPYDGQTWKIGGLREEIAWMGDTSWPGLGGNTGLAGHVTLGDGSNGPFSNLYKVQPGDLVMLYTQKNIYTYTVREQRTVEDDSMFVVGQSSNPQLTLITCSNWDTNMRLYLNRLVVFADLKSVEPIRGASQGN